MKKIDINPDILMGLSSSATQIDGGDIKHSWDSWHSSGKMMELSGDEPWANHWENFRDDVALLSNLGVQTYKFSIEWARVEPNEGEFDEFAIDQIKEELMLLLAMKIRPVICLHHFTNPQWFEKLGGWAMPKNIVYYLRYVEKIIGKIGHLCDDYITINEINTYAFNGYYSGKWPPAKKSYNTTMNVMSVMAAAHIRAYRLIHRLRDERGLPKSMVGVSMQMRVFEGKNRSNPAHNASAMLAERTFQTLIIEAVTVGKFSSPLKNLARAKIGKYCDFHGMNFTTRTIITPLGARTKPYCTKNDSGTEICPRGLTVCAKKLIKICDLPIFVTDNGVSDTKDAFRCRFIYENIMEISRSDLPFERYYHRSFLDGFEWTEGFSAKYGLVEIELDSGKRKIKKSGEFYSELIKLKAITSEMYEKYISMQSYHH